MKVLVTGGCGFIGTNIDRRHVSKGDTVIIVDNLSREGSKKNRDWAKENGCEIYEAPVESGIMGLVTRKHPDIEIVYHMAAQVAVTTSIKEPLKDAQVNIYGTLMVLEAVKENCPKAFVIYASTNKVYGALNNGFIFEEEPGDTRYYGGPGVSEDTPVDFHSPYGCSKGAADQYVRDYARIYGLKTVVFRQSCIYGDHQSGMEDQGWLSWFCQKALKGETITIFGDGKQVRDILYIDDLLDLFDIAYKSQDVCSGQIYNIGGGKENTISLLELIDVLRTIAGPVAYVFKDWRDGDQKIYISDISKAKIDFGWEPKISLKEGVLRLYNYTKGIV